MKNIKLRFLLLFLSTFSIHANGILLPVRDAAVLEYYSPSLVNSQAAGLITINSFLHLPLGKVDLWGSFSSGKYQNLYSENLLRAAAGYRLLPQISLLAGYVRTEHKLPDLSIHNFTHAPFFAGDLILSTLRARVLYQNLKNYSGSLAYYDSRLIPLELQFQYELRENEGTLRSAIAYSFSREVGSRLGFEPHSNSTFAGFWISPSDSLRFDIELTLPSRQREEVYSRVQLTWNFRRETYPEKVFTESLVPRQKIFRRRSARKNIEFVQKQKAIPSFQTLMRWGIAPLQAAKIVRSRDICSGNEKSQEIAASHSWKCREGSK